MISVKPICLRSRVGASCLALLAVFVVFGCDEEVTAILRTDRAFEVYGVLSPAADTQYVRVFPIAERLGEATDREIDATVTSTDLESGEAVTWRDSLLTYEDGTFGHLFWAPFRPLGGRAYRVDVTRSDGAGVRVTAAVPRLPEFLEPTTSGGVVQPVRFGASEIGIEQTEVEYFVEHGWCAGEIERFTFPYSEEARSSGDLQEVRIALENDFERMKASLLQRARYNWVVGIVPRHVNLRMTVGEAAWSPPGGVFDPEVLVEPGLFSNVENGFGFVGGGYSIEVLLYEVKESTDSSEKVEPSTIEAAGFTLVAPQPFPDKTPACVPYP